MDSPFLELFPFPKSAVVPTGIRSLLPLKLKVRLVAFDAPAYRDLSMAGAYLALPDPFSKGASIRIKIRPQKEFFQADATVAHSTHGLGMGVMFQAVSPPFLIVLREWLFEAQSARVRDLVQR